MMVLPVFARELRAGARRPGTYRLRTLFFLITFIVVAWFLLDSHQSATSARVGQELFTALSFVFYIYAGLIGTLVASDCLSFEKREETLGLLFLTPLKKWDVVLGKMAGGLLAALYGFFSVIPFLSLPLLFGGVLLIDVVLLILGQLVVILLSLSIAVFVSSISTDSRKAAFASLFIMILFVVAPIAIALSFAPTAGPVPWLWIFLSPFGLLMFNVASTQAMGGMPPASYFFNALYFFLVCALFFLILACVFLPKTSSTSGSAKKSGPPWQPSFGTRKWRESVRRKLLGRNAYLWLASREVWAPWLAWVLVVSLLIIFLVPRLRGGVISDVSLLSVFILHPLLKVWMLMNVIQPINQARRSGALELILTTPLKTSELIKGQWLAQLRLFGGPVAFLILVQVAALSYDKWLPMDLPREAVSQAFLAGPLLLFWDAIVFPVVAMMDALVMKSKMRAFFLSYLKLMILPGVLWIFWNEFLRSPQNWQVPDYSTYSMWFWICFWVNLLFFIHAKALLPSLRAFALEPVGFKATLGRIFLDPADK